MLSWGGIVFFPRRNNVSRRRPPVVSTNILAGILFSNIISVIHQFAAFVGMYESKASLMGVMPFNINTLINYRALLVGNLCRRAIVLFLLFVLPQSAAPAGGIYSAIVLQIDSKAKRKIVIWLAVLTTLMFILCMPHR